jgi:hypothetical protein
MIYFESIHTMPRADYYDPLVLIKALSEDPTSYPIQFDLSYSMLSFTILTDGCEQQYTLQSLQYLTVEKDAAEDTSRMLRCADDSVPDQLTMTVCWLLIREFRPIWYDVFEHRNPVVKEYTVDYLRTLLRSAHYNPRMHAFYMTIAILLLPEDLINSSLSDIAPLQVGQVHLFTRQGVNSHGHICLELMRREEDGTSDRAHIWDGTDLHFWTYLLYEYRPDVDSDSDTSVSEV